MAKKYLDFLILRTVEEVKSSLSGSIKVVSFLNKPRIIVKNMIQSGGMVKSIWKKGLKKLVSYNKNPKTVLILGLGGGTAANLINQTFPQAKIIGIELDPIMIKLAKKYFNLDEIKNLKIINGEATKEIKSSKLKTKSFDLILVDLYIGDKVPFEAESPEFLKNLEKLISPRGMLIFNRLFYQKHKKKTEDFINKLEKVFSRIELTRAFSNLLVFAFR